MKAKIFLLGSICFFILTACPGNSYHPSQKKLKDNNMDFPDLEKAVYHDIHFQLSNLFERDYNPKYIIKNKAFAKSIDDISIHFSIEHFSEKEAAKFQFDNAEEVNKLNAVQDFYISKRENSLVEPNTSIKKDIPKSVGFKGIMQTVQGPTSEDGIISNYLTATLKIGKDYYVFQLISNKGNTGYLYDDFIDILNSVAK